MYLKLTVEENTANFHYISMTFEKHHFLEFLLITFCLVSHFTND